ncbi:MAG: glycosyltransferase family 2 protein [Chloroflexi bacterium]|nr:MAG: glycosyltransferase family 2 protein [Chloroflexota bacterium]
MDGTRPVAIVVLNYNGKAHLSPLLESLARQTRRDFELVIVDNGSTDGSRALLEAEAARGRFALTLLRNPANRGFAPACNQGIAATRTPWVIMLNNDTRPEPHWLERMMATVEQPDPRFGPKLGMVAAKLLRAHQPDQIDSAGIALDWTGIAWDWRGGEPDDPAESEPMEIFGPCGGAALYARRMLDAVGGFDDDFFAYLEDVDLAWRARLAGWRCLLQPQARVLHAHSGTLGDASPRKRYLLARNKVWLLVKNYPAPWFALLLPLIVGYDLLAVGFGIARRGDLASLRGRLDGLRQLPVFWRKRRAVQRAGRDVANWRRCMMPVSLPWSVPKRYAHLEEGRRRAALPTL